MVQEAVRSVFSLRSRGAILGMFIGLISLNMLNDSRPDPVSELGHVRAFGFQRGTEILEGALQPRRWFQFVDVVRLRFR